MGTGKEKRRDTPRAETSEDDDCTVEARLYPQTYSASVSITRLGLKNSTNRALFLISATVVSFLNHTSSSKIPGWFVFTMLLWVVPLASHTHKVLVFAKHPSAGCVWHDYTEQLKTGDDTGLGHVCGFQVSEAAPASGSEKPSAPSEAGRREQRRGRGTAGYQFVIVCDCCQRLSGLYPCTYHYTIHPHVNSLYTTIKVKHNPMFKNTQCLHLLW